MIAGHPPRTTHADPVVEAWYGSKLEAWTESYTAAHPPRFEHGEPS